MNTDPLYHSNTEPASHWAQSPDCKASHPDYPEAVCYRPEGHTGAHSALSARGSYTWGIAVYQAVSTFEHAGYRYIMLDAGEGTCCFVGERASKTRAGWVDWRFTLSGQHIGPTLDVWLTNVRLEYDDDGPGCTATWDSMLWADDETTVEDDACLDGYGEALQPEVEEILCQR